MPCFPRLQMHKRKLYIIETKSDKVAIQAEDREHAFAQYFMDIKTQKIPLDKIGNLVILKDNDEDYPFRTVPLLWRMDVIDEETAIVSLQQLFEDMSRNEIRKMLHDLGEKDAERMVPLIDELAEER